MISTWIAAQGWKLATGTAAIASIILGFLLAQTYMENRHLVHQIEVAATKASELQANLAQSRTNGATLQVSLDRQNLALKTQKFEAEQRLQEVEAALEATRRENRQQAERLRKILATPPKGATVEDRYNDIDRRLLESLN